MINTFRTLREKKVDNFQKHTGNIRKKTEIVKKNQTVRGKSLKHN